VRAKIIGALRIIGKMNRWVIDHRDDLRFGYVTAYMKDRGERKMSNQFSPSS
jgi:hypothetical protein